LKRNIYFPIKKVKKREGTNIEGRLFKPEILERYTRYSGKLFKAHPKIGNINISNPKKVKVNEYLYENLMNLLRVQTPYKKKMNC
jgi:hypothetical protein